MRALKSLMVIVAALSLPSCTVYMREGNRAHHPCDESSGGLGVIGVAIGRADESRRGPIVVEHVFPGSPAGDAEIRPGDRIRAIDGESTHGMTIPEAARLIRGRAYTPVELRLESPLGARLVTLVRLPPRATCDHRRRHDGHHDGHHPCHRYRHVHDAPPPAAMAPPDDDESLDPEVPPPAAPCHHPH